VGGSRLGDHGLPRGRHDLSAEEVAANQRWRLIAAASALVAERGVAEVTAQAIAREAGVSSSTLYRLFGGADGVLLAAFEAAADALTRVISAAGPGAGDEGRAARLIAACEWAAMEPRLAAMLGIGPAVALPELAAARERLAARLTAPLITRPPAHESDEETLRRLLVAAVLSTLAERAPALRPPAARRLGCELAALLG
jgi:AcrR family transcriptional regulator